MKIVLFIDSLCAGGAQRQLVGLAKLLKEKGVDTEVLTYHKDEFYLPFPCSFAIGEFINFFI